MDFSQRFTFLFSSPVFDADDLEGLRVEQIIGSIEKMGFQVVRARRLEDAEIVVQTDAARGLILVEGSVPGFAGGYVRVRDAVKKALPKDAPSPGKFRVKAEAGAALGVIGVLVANAGIASRGRSVADTDPDEVERLLRTHAIGGMVLAKHIVPAMRSLDRGDIVFISSVATTHMPAYGAPYNMAKAAQEALAWTTPQPRADLVGPATVTVGAEPDIEVLPDGDGMRGLVRRVVPAPRRAVRAAGRRRAGAGPRYQHARSARTAGRSRLLDEPRALAPRGELRGAA